MWGTGLLNFIYPRINKCVCCENEIDCEYICKDCLYNVTLNKSKESILINGVNCYNATFYNGSIKEIIYNFKVYKNFDSGRYLSKILFNYINYLGIDFDLITFIPRDNKKKKLEGFDQSEFLSKELGVKFDKKSIRLFSCSGKKEQKKMDLNNREMNVKGKFKCVNVNKIKDKKILIIDDIATTYNTIKECIYILKQKENKCYISVLTIGKSII